MFDETVNRTAYLAIQDVKWAWMEPHVLMRPSLAIDGNQWVALYGKNIQEGVAGFGDSPAAAMGAFDAAWNEKIARPPATAKEEWIPASERLPESEGAYLVSNGRHVAEAEWREGDFAVAFHPGDGFPASPTHWMNLPAAPSSPSDGKGEGK